MCCAVDSAVDKDRVCKGKLSIKLVRIVNYDFCCYLAIEFALSCPRKLTNKNFFKLMLTSGN